MADVTQPAPNGLISPGVPMVPPVSRAMGYNGLPHDTDDGRLLPHVHSFRTATFVMPSTFTRIEKKTPGKAVLIQTAVGAGAPSLEVYINGQAEPLILQPARSDALYDWYRLILSPFTVNSIGFRGDPASWDSVNVFVTVFDNPIDIRF